jgi:hypothetical protein
MSVAALDQFRVAADDTGIGNLRQPERRDALVELAPAAVVDRGPRGAVRN